MIVDLTSTRPGASALVRDRSSESSFIAAALERAEWGDAEAYYQLALAYSEGSHGVGRDLIEACKWFGLAAAQEHDEAKRCRIDIAEKLTATEIAEAKSRARLWLVVNQRLAA